MQFLSKKLYFYDFTYIPHILHSNKYSNELSKQFSSEFLIKLFQIIRKFFINPEQHAFVQLLALYIQQEVVKEVFAHTLVEKLHMLAGILSAQFSFSLFISVSF